MATVKSPAKRKPLYQDNIPTEVKSDTTIDYPQEGSAIDPGCYAIRITSNSGTGVEISINKGPWEACRSAIGYYWFDWNAMPGEITIVARTKAGPNKWKLSSARRATVTGAEKN